MKILITGGPKTGKTELAKQFSGGYRSTDELADLDWHEQSDQVAEWFDNCRSQVIEGVTIPRALRKWLDTHDGIPCDLLIFLSTPKGAVSDDQKKMAKSVHTVMGEVYDELIMRGMDVVGFGDAVDSDEIYVC